VGEKWRHSNIRFWSKRLTEKNRMEVLSGTWTDISCLDQGFKCFAKHLTWGWQPFVFTEFKAIFDDWCFTSYLYSLFTCSACARRLHVGGDGGITRKYRNPKASRSTRKVCVATQRQCWWEDANTEAPHQKPGLLQLVTVIQER